VDQIRQEMSSVMVEPKLSAVIWQNAENSKFHDKEKETKSKPSPSVPPSPSPSPAPAPAPALSLPLGGKTDTPNGGDDLIDYEKRAQIVKVSYKEGTRWGQGQGQGTCRMLSALPIAYQFQMSDLWGPVTAPIAMWQLFGCHTN